MYIPKGTFPYYQFATLLQRTCTVQCVIVSNNWHKLCLLEIVFIYTFIFVKMYVLRRILLASAANKAYYTVLDSVLLIPFICVL